MKINWKEVSKSPGYIAIKGKYIKDAMDAGNSKFSPMRDKEELYHRHFKWIISRAKHYAHMRGTTIESVLNKWAADPGNQYCWLNVYQDCRMPRLDRTKHISMGIPGIRKHYKHMYRHDPTKGKKQVQRYINNTTGSKKKERWSSAQKKRAKRNKELILKYGL